MVKWLWNVTNDSFSLYTHEWVILGGYEFLIENNLYMFSTEPGAVVSNSNLDDFLRLKTLWLVKSAFASCGTSILCSVLLQRLGELFPRDEDYTFWTRTSYFTTYVDTWTWYQCTSTYILHLYVLFPFKSFRLWTTKREP